MICLELVTVLLIVDAYQIQALPKSLQDQLQSPRSQNIDANNKVFFEDLEKIIELKNPESMSFSSRSGDGGINKLEFIEREIEYRHGNPIEMFVSLEKPELPENVSVTSALQNGIKLIESENYECRLSKGNATDKTIVCKERNAAPLDSNAIEHQSLQRPSLPNFDVELEVSDSSITTKTFPDFAVSSDSDDLETVSKLEELFSEMRDTHILAKVVSDENDSNFTSFVFNPVAQPEEKFQNCTTPTNETGHCRYIQHCLIPSILGNLNQFMQYVCIIQGAFIGVCCPELPVTEIDVEWPDNETAVEDMEIANSTTDAANITTDANSECGIATNVRIIGGSNADRKAWPWMVALLAKSRDAFFCGGALINTRYVLTAAHCTFGIPKNMITARLGEYDLKAEVHLIHEDFAVVKIKRHGQYSQRTLQNDIALLLLEKAVTFNNFIMTICLPERNFDYVNRTATLAGWGNLEGGGPTSDVLQVASFPVIANDDCQSNHGVPIDDSAICTGSDDKGACNGDSGGPLMLLDDNDRWKTIAIVSWGRRGCNPKFPTVYTRVSFYLDWISKHANLSEIS